MPDVDLPKAEHVLSVLRQARLSRNETAATMIAELVYEMAYTDLREPEIEGARKAAWIEISALAAPQSGIVRTARYVERRPQSHGKVEKVVGLGSWRCCGLFPLFQYAKAIDDGAVIGFGTQSNPFPGPTLLLLPCSEARGANGSAMAAVHNRVLVARLAATFPPRHSF